MSVVKVKPRKYARVSCAACKTVFRWRNLELLSKRIAAHKCWLPKEE